MMVQVAKLIVAGRPVVWFGFAMDADVTDAAASRAGSVWSRSSPNRRLAVRISL